LTIEELEIRVLLHGAVYQPSFPFLAEQLPFSPVTLSSQPQPFVQYTSDTAELGTTSSTGSGSGVPGLLLVPLNGPLSAYPSMVVLIGPPPGAAVQPTIAGAQDVATTTIESTQVYPFAADSMVAMSSSGGGGAMTSTGSYGYGTPYEAPYIAGEGLAFVSASSSGFTTSRVLPGTPQRSITAGEWRSEYAGTLSSDRPTMTIPIPLDGSGQLVDFSVHQPGGQSGAEVPVVGQLNLVDSSGNNLEQVGPSWGPGLAPPQSVGVLLHNLAPGEHLMVQITAAEPTSSSSTSPSSSPTTATGTTATETRPANWNVSFVLDVQTQQAQLSNSAAVSLAQGPTAIGTLIVAPSLQSGSVLTSSTATAATEDVGESFDGPVIATADVPPSAPTDLALDLTEGFDDRVSTGPLASRSAGPLGPTLAAIDADPTQPVDRHERALSQDIDALATGIAAETTASRSDRNAQTPSALPGSLDRSTERLTSDEPVVAVAGRGGFPLKVTAPSRAQPLEFAALWATLPTAGHSAIVGPASAESGSSPPENLRAPAADRRAAIDPLECPDYVKAACGLALGLGLTSGPLFSDLIATRPGRISSWMFAFSVRVRRAWPGSSRLKTVPIWLRGLVVRRS
jgi:hypothetical protein